MGIIAERFPTVARAFAWWLEGLRLPSIGRGPAALPRLELNQGFEGLSDADQRKARSIGLALDVPEAEWLTLSVELPPAARDEQQRMAAFEIAEQTPLEPEDVWFDIEETRSGQALHVVSKRITQSVLAALNEQGVSVSWLVSDGGKKLRLHGGGADQTTRLGWYLCLGLAVIAVLASVLFWDQSKRIAEIEARRIAATPGATATRQIEAQIELLKSGQGGLGGAGASVVEVLERTTQIVPDVTFLSEFTIEDRTLVISGQGQEIEALVRALEADPMFADVRIQGALSTDDVGVSSFQIRAELQ